MTDDDHCPCIPADVNARWKDMTPSERLPWVNRHMGHVIAEVLAPPSRAWLRFINSEKDDD